MITTNTGAKKLESSDNWREIFPNPDLSTAGAHNASVDAADRIQPEIAPIINGKQCALGAASGDYVLLRNSTITGKSDGAYIATKAIPANTDIDSTYLGNAITGGISNSLNNNLRTQELLTDVYTVSVTTGNALIDYPGATGLGQGFETIPAPTNCTLRKVIPINASRDSGIFRAFVGLNISFPNMVSVYGTPNTTYAVDVIRFYTRNS